MAYQVDKFNGTFLVSVADGTVDTTTDLRLLGKNYAGYGEVQNENFLHLLENFANTSAPPKAINGQIWFDSANKRIKFYDETNNKWRTASNIEIDSTAPVKMNTGDFWYDTTADQVYIWNGTQYILVGPPANVGVGANATEVAIVKDVDGINHTIVKLLAGTSSDTVAIVSVESFELDVSLFPITGFSFIKKGITLVNTQDNTYGITTTNDIIWGTASTAKGLVSTTGDYIAANNVVLKNSPAFTGQGSFPNAGFTVGSGAEMRIWVDTGSLPIIESRNSSRITVRIVKEDSTSEDIMEFIPSGASNGAALPGTNNLFDLGATNYRWANVYATTFNGALTGNVTGNVVGEHKGNLRAADNSIAYDATERRFTGAFTGILTGNVIGDLSGTSSNAFRLDGNAAIVGSYNPSTEVVTTAGLGTTIALRDTSGNLIADNFYGTATRAKKVQVDGGSYRTAVTTPTANTIVARDGSGNISVNFVNGTITAANSLQADGGPYRTASVAPVGNTIVVRDAAGNINVNGILGIATQATSLQVDGTDYRTASISASANTIAVRDSSGILRAASIQGTPIGTSSAAAGGFTTLDASGLVRVTNTTASNSTTSGAVIISGGLGVAGSVYASNFNGTFTGSFTGNIAGNASTASTANTATTATTLSATLTGTNATNLIYASVADNDYFRLRVGGSATDGGWVELATADNGTEPIYVRQYSGVFGSVVRSATLLDGSGNTDFPGTVTVTRLVETSSIAYKENVNPIDNALELVNKLTGVTYDRKDGTSKKEAGLIAEEVAKILPNIVQLNKDGSADGVQYTKLTAYLIEAVKSLTKQVEELQSKLK